MRPRRHLLIGVAVLAIGFVGTRPAGAVDSVVSGWWTNAPVALAPDVPSGQLLVQGGPDEPLAYAGMSFALADGERARTLVLSVAPDSASTPGSTLRLCPLTEPATEAAGGAAADGPGYDCASAVEADAPGGQTYEFDVAQIPASATLDVAIVPAAATDRVVLTAPTADDLVVSGGSATAGPDTGSGSTTFDPPPSPGFDAGGSTSGAFDGSGSFTPAPSGSSGLDLPAAGAGAGATPEPADDAAADADSDTVPVASPTPFQASPASATGSSGNRVLPLVVVVLAGAAAICWALAGGSRPELAA
jgi:hypothetical protein